jgi:hypothetical protein
MRAIHWLRIGLKVAHEYQTASQCIDQIKRLAKVYREIGDSYVALLDEFASDIPDGDWEILEDCCREANESLEAIQHDFSFTHPPDLSEAANAIKNVAVAALYLCESYVPTSGVKSYSVDAQRGVILVNNRDRFCLV